MFNNYTNIHKGGDSYSRSDVKVTENRAPTDESIKILKEMEEKSLDKLISITRLDNNLFKATWHIFDNYLDNSFNVCCRFLLNEKEYNFKFSVCRYEYRNTEKLVETIRSRILTEIEEIFSIDLFRSSEDQLIRHIRE